MVRKHVQILDIRDCVKVVAKTSKHKRHSPKMLEKMSAHVALDMNQIVVHLRRVATFFLYKKKK